MKNLLRLMVLTLLVAAPAFAQTAPANDEAKTAAYTAFYNAVTANKQDDAYRLGKEYLTKYGSDTDDYTKYIKSTVETYEKGQRAARIGEVFTAISAADPKKADYNKAFTTGRQILQTEPNNLNVLINLGYAGYAASASSNASFNQEAVGYATKAINLIEQGSKPEDLYPDNADFTEFYPFKTRDDALAYLNFGLAEMNFKTNPKEAARYFSKAASYNSTIKTTPVVYQRLAAAYENVYSFNQRAQKFQTDFGGKEETPESIAAQQELFPIIDLLMDAHARVIAYSGTNAQYQAAKTNSQTLLNGYYQFRNDNKTDGLQDYTSGIQSKPLPEPGAMTAPTATPATSATPATTATPQTTGTPSTPPAATTTTARPATTTAPPAATSRPAATTSTGTVTTQPATTNRPATTTRPTTPARQPNRRQ